MNNFTIELDGTTVNELNQKIDYSKTKLEDRKKVVEDILSSTNFYQEYFDEYYNPSIGRQDPLSHENDVCRSLERMANYLLNSDEVKEKKKKEEKTKYVFYTDKNYFEKKVNKERSVESLTESNNTDYGEVVIHFLKREDKNYILERKQTITKRDLERKDFLGRVLRDYKTFYDYITNKLKNSDSELNRFLLARVKGQVEDDMIYSKEALLGVFGYHLRGFSESTKYNVDVFDFTNPLHLKGGFIETESGKTVHVKGLLFLKPDFDPNDEFSFVLLDLQKIIEKANLTEFEKEVLEQVRDGLTQDEIAENLKTYQMKISRTIDTIVKKVAAVGDKYDCEEEAEIEVAEVS